MTRPVQTSAIQHLCHAFGCKTEVPPRLLMCGRHWRMVPKEVQRLIRRTYRPGQEVDKHPSKEYVLAQRAAVWSVYLAEGKCAWTDVPEVGSREYLIGPAVLNRNAVPAAEQTELFA